jgi:hypothetical protein
MSGQTKEAAPTTSKASTDELKEQELYEFFFCFSGWDFPLQTAGFLIAIILIFKFFSSPPRNEAIPAYQRYQAGRIYSVCHSWSQPEPHFNPSPVSFFPFLFYLLI